MIAGLPYDAEIEYIQTSGTQYINTGVPASSPLVSEVRFRWLDGNIGNDKYILAMSGSTRFYFGTYQSYWMFGFYSYSQAAGIEANKDYVATCRWETPTAKLYIDGELKTSINWSREISNNGNLLICNRSSGGAGGTQWRALARIYHCKIYQGSLLVRDFIPVRVGTEGCLYDRVSKKLFRNAGTGSFVTGPDVAVPVMGLHFMRRPRYTAKDYVQNRLVAMWDGIENAGWGVHDASATSWKELISGTDCEIVGNLSTNYLWSGKSLVRNTENRGYFVYDATARLQDSFRNATFTVEATTSQPVNNANWQAQIINICQTSQVGIYSQGMIARWRRENNGTMGNLSGATYTSGAGLTLDSVDALATFSCAYNSGQYVSYLDGEQKSTGSATPDSTIDGVWVRLGSSGYGFRGHYHSIRIYSRALTADEIAHNYAVDKERFNLT